MNRFCLSLILTPLTSVRSHQAALKIQGKTPFFIWREIQHILLTFCSLFFCSRYAHKFLEIQNPRVLGPAVSPGAVYLASTLQEQVEMLCFQGTSALASVFQPEDDDDSMSIISELSRLSSPSRRSSLVRSPSWSPGHAKVKSLRGGSVKKSSSFRTARPLREENM